MTFNLKESNAKKLVELAYLGFYILNREELHKSLNEYESLIEWLMGTSSKGTSVSQFKSGIKKYVNRQGYSLSFQSLMSWGKIKYDTVKATVQQGKAIALFLLGYRGITITQNEGYDILTYEYTTANHVVAGFGCLEVNYTFADNSTRTDRYLIPFFGFALLALHLKSGITHRLRQRKFYGIIPSGRRYNFLFRALYLSRNDCSSQPDSDCFPAASIPRVSRRRALLR